MARLSVNEVTTYRWSFEEDVAHYVRAGISAMGVWRQKISDFGDERGVELLADSGLRVSNLLWAGGFTGSDGRTFRDSVDDAREAIELASALGTDCLVVYTGARSLHTHNHARRLTRDAMQAVLPMATELGITLAIEPMHPQCAGEWTFLTTLDEALKFIGQFESPRVKLALDTYHLGHEPSLVERIPEFVDSIAVVHLADGRPPVTLEEDRTPLGKGEVPLAPLVRALERANYSGYYDLELTGEELESIDYCRLLDDSKHEFAQLCRCGGA
ncbi:MAG: sugar phosphate isomerase/epimerase family protein [Pirellulales bacterium]